MYKILELRCLINKKLMFLRFNSLIVSVAFFALGCRNANCELLATINPISINCSEAIRQALVQFFSGTGPSPIYSRPNLKRDRK
jgi:hypothetical protein